MEDIDRALISIFKTVFIELENTSDESIMGLQRGSFVAWDSGAHLVLITCLEEEFKVKLDDETAIGIESFAMARALVTQ